MVHILELKSESGDFFEVHDQIRTFSCERNLKQLSAKTNRDCGGSLD